MAKKKNTDERERILELLLSQDELNIRLAFQLQRSTGVDLSDFWEDLQELYKISQLRDCSNKFTLLPYASELSEIAINAKHPLYTEGINAENQYLKNLEKITLQASNEPILPFWVYDFSQIKFLIFSGFNLRSLHSDMQGLKNLRSLNLSQQPLSFIPDWVGNFENLRELNLSGLGLKALPDCLRRLSKLRYLFVSNNEITELPDWIGELKELCILDIRDNQISQLPDSIGTLAKLSDIRLSDNPDMDWKQVITLIRELPALKTIYWVDRQILTFDPPLASHQSITLSNGIKTLETTNWAEAIRITGYMLHNFKDLYIDNLDISDVPESIQGIPSLETLSMQYNPIDSLPDFLLEMPNLKSIDLRGTQIKEVPEAFLKKEGLEIKI